MRDAELSSRGGPVAAATRFAAYLEAYANPRKDSAAGADQAAPTDPFTRLPYPRRMGEALCQLLESIDITRLPIHGGDATTLVITMSLDSLRTDLATADLPDAWPAPPTSSPPSSAPTASRSTWAAPNASSAPDNAKRS